MLLYAKCSWISIELNICPQYTMATRTIWSLQNNQQGTRNTTGDINYIPFGSNMMLVFQWFNSIAFSIRQLLPFWRERCYSLPATLLHVHENKYLGRKAQRKVEIARNEWILTMLLSFTHRKQQTKSWARIGKNYSSDNFTFAPLNHSRKFFRNKNLSSKVRWNSKPSLWASSQPI